MVGLWFWLLLVFSSRTFQNPPFLFQFGPHESLIWKQPASAGTNVGKCGTDVNGSVADYQAYLASRIMARKMHSL